MGEIKGYNTADGYVGWVSKEHKWILFASERDYLDYVSAEEGTDG